MVFVLGETGFPKIGSTWTIGNPLEYSQVFFETTLAGLEAGFADLAIIKVDDVTVEIRCDQEARRAFWRKSCRRPVLVLKKENALDDEVWRVVAFEPPEHHLKHASRPPPPTKPNTLIPPLITLRPGVGITPVNLIYIEGALRRMAWVARSRRTLLKSSYCSLKSFHLSCWAQNCRFAVTFRWYFRKQVFICSEATEHTCEGLDLNWDDISGKIRNLCALWPSIELLDEFDVALEGMGQVGEGDGEHDDKCTAASALFMSPSTPNSQGSMAPSSSGPSSPSPNIKIEKLRRRLGHFGIEISEVLAIKLVKRSVKCGTLQDAFLERSEKDRQRRQRLEKDFEGDGEWEELRKKLLRHSRSIRELKTLTSNEYQLEQEDQLEDGDLELDEIAFEDFEEEEEEVECEDEEHELKDEVGEKIGEIEVDELESDSDSD